MQFVMGGKSMPPRKTKGLSGFLFEDEQVYSSRTLHVFPAFTMSTLLYLQETGELTALQPKKSEREGLVSYLFFMVEKGSGCITANDTRYELKAGDCALIDCSKPYSHTTEQDLWTLRWAHFHGCSADALYRKYMASDGRTVFTPDNPGVFHDILAELMAFEPSTAFVTDLAIHEKLTHLFSLIFEHGIQRREIQPVSAKRNELIRIRDYLDEHCTENIVLDDLAALFFINKFYLSHIFKKEFGTTINGYITQLRIIMAKKNLRFTNWKIEKISMECGYADINYFIRVFKKYVSMTPSEYRTRWRS